MSIFSDPRRYSDDPEEYLEWRWEAERECKGDDMYPDDTEEGDDDDCI